MPARFAAALLYLMAKALTALPWPVLRRLADTMAWTWRNLDARESRVAQRNLELAYPELLPAERKEMHAGVLRYTARQLLETLRIWTRPASANLPMIREQWSTRHARCGGSTACGSPTPRSCRRSRRATPTPPRS